MPTIPEDLSTRATAPAVARDTLPLARVARGLLLFALLTVVGLWIAQRRGTFGDGWTNALRTVSITALAVGGLQAVLDQLMGGLRIWLCARALGEHPRLPTCILANGANVFMGGVTPSQHAGGPAQIWVLTHNGMRLIHATVTSFCTYLGTVTFFLVLAVFVTRGHSELPVVGALRLFTRGTVLLFAATLLLAALALPRPEAVIGVLRAVLSRIPFGGARLVHSAAVRGVEQLLRDYSHLTHQALRRGKLLLLAVIGLSALLYINKFVIAYVVARGLGLQPALGDVLYLQSVQSLITYFAPTPGASGVAEVAAAELMHHAVPEASMGAFILLWRVLTLYVGMAFGAVTVIATGFATWRGPAPERTGPRVSP